MPRLRVDLAYDGAPFHGFARQPDVPTVQGTLEDALGRVLDQPVTTTCAGRTDRGVHARAQVVHVDVDAAVPAAERALAAPRELRRRLDLMVGPAITVWRVRGVPDDFDARHSATERRYVYHLVDAPIIDPLRRAHVWHVPQRLDVPAMRRAARHLEGEHDFSALCRSDDAVVRRLDAVTIVRHGSDVRVRARAPAFCHQQVRSITGVLVHVGRGRRGPEWAAELLASRERSRAPAVAPPRGLVLEGVSYGRRFPAAPPPEAR